MEVLPFKKAGESLITLLQKVQKRAVILESSDQYAVMVGNCYENESFYGKYIPFLMAASDRYTIPKLRFQMGAYSAGINFTAYSGAMLMYSYSDPNAAQTVNIFEGTADAIAGMELTQEDQKAAAECIREIISQSGTATVGNEAQLKADQDAYDQILSYKADSESKAD